MPPPIHPRIKQLGIGIAAILLLAGLVSLLMPWFIDAEKRKSEINQFLQSTYGLTFETGGAAEVTTYPSPKIIFADATIKEAEGSNLLHAPTLVIHIGWMGLFSTASTSIEMIQPDITLSYSDISQLIGYLTKQSTSSAEMLPANVRLTQATLNTKNAAGKEMQSYRQLNADIGVPKQSRPARLLATATFHDKPFSIDLFVDAAESHQAKAEITLNQRSKITMEGVFNPENTPMWQGKMHTDIADIGEVAAFFTNGHNVPDLAIPLTFDGVATLDGDSLSVNRTDAMVDQNKGTFAAYIGWQNTLAMAFELDAEQLDLKRFSQALEPSFIPASIAQSTGVAPLVVAYSADHSISLVLNADNAVYGQKKYQKLNMHAEMNEGNIIIHHANMHMPGNTELDVEGAMTQQPEGRRFAGVAKIRGDKLNTWLADFEPYAENLPPEDFSAFALEGNLFISAEQLRLSEARLVINDFELLGGFATYFEKMPRVEAEIKLKYANLDYFRDAWRTESNLSDDGNYQLLIGNKTRFDWLKRLPAILDFNIAIDSFRFLDNDGQLATMRLYATPGEMSLYGIDVRFPENTLSGNLKLNVMGERPKLNVVFTTNSFNTDYFNTDASSEDVPWFDPKNSKKRWSDKLFDVRWMSTVDGSIDLSVGKLDHEGHTYQGFKWRADLENTAMTIQKLSFNYLGGSFDLNGTFIGGKVPGLSASFALYNGDLKELLSEYFNTEDIEGRISVTGVASTSGIHMQSWIEQGDMKLTTVARGVKVKNLNLQSVVDTTAAARSTQDVAEGVRNLIFDGSTELAVDGNLNFQHGAVKTPGIRLVTGRISGSLTGEMQLLPWTLNLTTNWQFPELSTTTVPTMSMSQQGGINDYTTRVDTASLEAFVAKRIISQ